MPARGPARRACVLVVGAAVDRWMGEPPAELHPVVWIGSAIGALERRAPPNGPARQLAWGAGVAAGVPLSAALAAGVVARAARGAGVAGLLIAARALTCVVAARGPDRAATGVERALERGDEEGARLALRSLVSRETAGLNKPLLAAAAIESVAENLTDSIAAPWLAYAVAGLPGAYAYRAVNTLDSMLGYRGRYEYLGKVPARLDDLVNLIPARLTALALTLASPVGGGSAAGALRGAAQDHGRTASPNAGWTMAAMAGALGVRLEKAGHYVLGDGREPEAPDIGRARRIVRVAAALMLAALVMVLGGRVVAHDNESGAEEAQ
jgi:adenosylcobinamide-phosphate synthase